jgi:hypothetical protein
VRAPPPHLRVRTSEARLNKERRAVTAELLPSKLQPLDRICMSHAHMTNSDPFRFPIFKRLDWIESDDIYSVKIDPFSWEFTTILDLF